MSVHFVFPADSARCGELKSNPNCRREEHQDIMLFDEKGGLVCRVTVTWPNTAARSPALMTVLPRGAGTQD